MGEKQTPGALCGRCGKPEREWPNDTDVYRMWIKDDYGYWHAPCWGKADPKDINEALTKLERTTEAEIRAREELITELEATVAKSAANHIEFSKIFREQGDRIAELEATVAKAFLRCQALEEAIFKFDERAEAVGGCSDGYCLVTGKKNGQHTNAGCSCWREKYTAQRMMTAGRMLRDAIAVLCHASPVPGCETSSAEGPPQSDDGEARNEQP